MSLQVWLPLNGDLNNQGLNSVVPTNHGAIINNNGKIGKCYSFGTAASDISLPASTMTNFTDGASVSFWIKILSWNTQWATFFQAGPASTAWTAYIFGVLRNNTGSNLCFTISDGSSSSSAGYTTSNLELNIWYHLTFCYKTGHCLIYINGSLYKDYTTTIVPKFSNITSIRIGRCSNGSSYQTNCLLNDVRIYDHALSDKEVEEIAKGLVLHYKLDQPAINNIIYDSSGFQNNGIVTGDITLDDANTIRYENSSKQVNGSYIRVENRPAECMPKDAITVNLWQYATSWYNPISCTEGGGWNFENSSGIRFPVYISGVGYKVAQSTITPASTLNAWHMLTGTMDKDNIKIYYDGQEVGTVATDSTNGIGYANNYIFIGGEASGNKLTPASSAYVGNLSDVRIYATALTAEQILELYHTSASIDNNGNIYARELVEE